MRLRSFSIVVSVLSLGVASSVASETVVSDEEMEITIHCNTNEATIFNTRKTISSLTEEVKPLLKKRDEKELSEEENFDLHKKELEISRALVLLSIYEFWQFYCDNPGLLEKDDKSPTVDPASVA